MFLLGICDLNVDEANPLGWKFNQGVTEQSIEGIGAVLQNII